MNSIKKIIMKKGIQDLRPNPTALDKMGIKMNTWNKWVNNHKDPDLDQLPLIAEFLDCKVVDLLETENSPANAR